MMNRNITTEYKKLFRSTVNFWGGSMIVRAAEDHFLCCESNGYSEEYRRFFFADIRAIKMVKKRDWGLILSLLLFVIITGFTIAFSSDKVNLTLWGSMITVMTVIVAYCFIAGNPIEVKIITAYSNDTIKIGRQRRTKKHLRKMIAYLERAHNIQLDATELARLDEAEQLFKV